MRVVRRRARTPPKQARAFVRVACVALVAAVVVGGACWACRRNGESVVSREGHNTQDDVDGKKKAHEKSKAATAAGSPGGAGVDAATDGSLVAIYGQDDRRFDAPQGFDSGGRTVAFVHSSRVVELGNATYEGTSTTLGAQHDLCPDVPFFQERVVASCSGVLTDWNGTVATVATAAHCLRDCRCEHLVAVTGFVDGVRWSATQLWSCVDVRRCDDDRPLDWAVVVVEPWSPPLQRQSTHWLSHGQGDFRSTLAASGGGSGTWGPLLLVGHPSGMRRTYTTNGRVLDVRRVDCGSTSSCTLYRTTLDAFAGNSGSGVWTQQTDGTWALLGLLVNGAPDYERDEARGCQVPRRCDASSCSGETVLAVSPRRPSPTTAPTRRPSPTTAPTRRPSPTPPNGLPEQTELSSCSGWWCAFTRWFDTSHSRSGSGAGVGRLLRATPGQQSDSPATVSSRRSRGDSGVTD